MLRTISCSFFLATVAGRWWCLRWGSFSTEGGERSDVDKYYDGALSPRREGRGGVMWVNTTSALSVHATTITIVGGQLGVRRPWTDSWSVNDDSWVAALTVGIACCARLEHDLMYTHTRQQGNTPFFRPIHCTASLLERVTYTTVRLMHWFSGKEAHFMGMWLLRRNL